MIRKVLAWVFVAAVIVAGGGWFYLRSSLPQIDGTVSVKGLTAPVTIARDADGIPLITAANDDDAAFGLGYAHAQDRLFQMELQRRYGAGRLAEIFGPEAVPIDRQMRVLGLYHAAEAEWPHLPPEVQRALDAYAAGVNAFIATRHGALPPEFVLLRLTPEPWRPADTLVWGKLMDLQLGGNYRGELERARLARTVNPEDMAVLYPDYPKDGPTILADLAPIYRRLPLDGLMHAMTAAVGPTMASNNWVVDGAHSGSGKPLVANDPHLGFNAPGFWYLARLKTPQREIVGATVAGAPFVVIGHNDHVAWGFTTSTADIEDVFVEKLDPADPTHYLTPTGSAPFETRRETIRVKDKPPVELTVRSTRHGPVLSDILPADAGRPGVVLALQTTYLDADDTTAAMLWGIDRADDWKSFRTALKSFVGPPQNIVYADTSGTIGFMMPGHIPIRKSGNGWMPVPGWTGEYDWMGFIPFDDLPQATNPAAGHFSSANNKIVPDTYRYFISRDWDVPYRDTRITEMLAADKSLSPDASEKMQADTLSLMARQLLPLMTRVTPLDDNARAALDLLRRWDLRMDGDKPEPLIFTAWLRNFARTVFYNRLGAATAADYWALKPAVVLEILTTHQDWCGDEPCDKRLAQALDTALAQLRRDYGADMKAWSWGSAHIAEFPNPLIERIPLLKDWLKVAISSQGGQDTINVGPISVRDDAHPFVQRFGAGLRIVTDLADPAGSRMIVVPGQSGNPLSPHYRDLLTRWRHFDYLVPGRAEDIATLTLEPSR
ncbi:MAG TPA: penicillin acylase family protein [Stellaceae bacterium]